ncbi:DNA-binding FrmR family transcriptional regulator [Primorskyibacter sedentarius]|uniref:DNA-binding FrmR family transcriptional regulator n=1 Tax=Primorskyibacter sedentarius TaxID=745311 RepID=A0A4R3IYN0_9RHOB|nr:metal-sensitive transcriptional regulator [Primorskyibacter sedentarius]TCS56519.1 DNA-binding FrmR family transcriptional regulator [Primorskyibacter sedentarius]
MPLDRLLLPDGQVRGVAKTVERDRYCMDILAQTSAIRSAVLGVEDLVLEKHAKHCVGDAIGSGDPEKQRAKYDEMRPPMIAKATKPTARPV